ncbi:hypothetical protein [Aeromonas australiensis]|uniref:hypothetical protein n=1 Tax=Aeromonas australiensis TaxID=1114880 RepID=UPI001427CE60|nr:hypothetical protein [Aeromonas australiensis]
MSQVTPGHSPGHSTRSLYTPYPDRGAADLLEGANAPPTGPSHGMQGTLIGGGASLFVIVQASAVDILGTQLIELMQNIENK